MLLARREIAARYDNAVLGVWWTLLTPLAQAAALWAVFSGVARFATPGVPFVVYVVSGVAVMTFVAHTVLGTAGVVAGRSVTMRRLPVPVGVFVFASALASLASLAIVSAAVLITQIAAGTGVPPSAVGLPLVLLLLAGAATSVGLMVGTLAVVFADALEMARIALTLAGFLTPIFYPLSIVPERFRPLVEINPLYSFVKLYRDLAYGDRVPIGTLAICAGVAVATAGAAVAVVAWTRRVVPVVL